jgi:hypothetical protein
MKLENILKFLDNNGFDKKQLETIKGEKQMLLSLVKLVSWSNQFSLIESLYIEKFIPQSENVDKEANIEILALQKEYGININYQNGALQETIRFGYIALYHKLENCRNEIIKTILPVFDISELEFKKSYESFFNTKFDKPKDGIVYKFSWIADCTKHQNAIVSERNNPPVEFAKYPKRKPLEIEKDTFKNDVQELKMHFKNLCFQALMVCIINEFKIDV